MLTSYPTEKYMKNDTFAPYNFSGVVTIDIDKLPYMNKYIYGRDILMDIAKSVLTLHQLSTIRWTFSWSASSDEEIIVYDVVWKVKATVGQTWQPTFYIGALLRWKG